MRGRREQQNEREERKAMEGGEERVDGKGMNKRLTA